MGLAKQSPVMSDELELSKSSLTTIIRGQSYTKFITMTLKCHSDLLIIIIKRKIKQKQNIILLA